VCHAAAHGTFLVEDYPLTKEDVELACVEYVADMYAGEHRPALEIEYRDPVETERVIDQIQKTILKNRRGF